MKFLELFFSSIVLFNQDCLATTDFLVMTELSFVEDIQTLSKRLGIPIQIWMQNEAPYTFATMIRRYAILSWPNIHKYNRVLYCDTDILVANNLLNIFSLLEDSTKFYTLKEGTLEHDYWGGEAVFDFQGRDAEIDPNTPGFCAGVFLFEPNVHTEKIIQEINQYIYNKMITPGNKFPICFDQPYVNYVFAKNKFHNNEVLWHYIVNRPGKVNANTIIYHFPEVTFTLKYTRMITFFHQLLKEKPFVNDKIAIVRDYLQKGIEFLQSYDEYNDPMRKPFAVVSTLSSS